MLGGALVGFAFLTKMLQAFLVVPGFALVYLLAAPTPLRRRLRQLLRRRCRDGRRRRLVGRDRRAVAGLGAALHRRLADNSVLELIFGYNGFGRLTGNETGSVGGGGAQGGSPACGAPTGLGRLFTAEIGGQIAWLLPAALVAARLLLWMARRAPRTDRAPGPGAAVGRLAASSPGWSSASRRGSSTRTTPWRWRRRSALWSASVRWMAWRYRARSESRIVLAAVVAVTAVWSYVLLDRSPDWLPWLRTVVLRRGTRRGGRHAAAPGRADRRPAGAAAVAGLALGRRPRRPGGVRGGHGGDAAHGRDPVGRAGGRGRLRSRRARVPRWLRAAARASGRAARASGRASRASPARASARVRPRGAGPAAPAGSAVGRAASAVSSTPERPTRRWSRC